MSKLRPENQKMKDFLAQNGIECRVFYIADGSMKRTWRLYNPKTKWSIDLADKLFSLGFVNFDGGHFDLYSRNGGVFCVFVRGHYELLYNHGGLTEVGSKQFNPTPITERITP
jgi:hypothetical protein